MKLNWEPEDDQICFACCSRPMVGACEWTLPAVEEVEQEPMEVVPDDNDNDTVQRRISDAVRYLAPRT